ncbi:MAG: hypothetical protein JO297_07770 [Nitrososphaeraceae archaeon]|nr:hypothetical protein [Nitrososphaeraceae archaeon]
MLLQTEKYLYGLASSPRPVTSDASRLKDAMSSLESNIMTLKQGGKISGLNLKPLPPNLLPLWNSVDNRLNIYKTYLTNKFLTLPSEARTVITVTTTTKTTTTDQSLVRKEFEPIAFSLIESSDRLVTLIWKNGTTGKSSLSNNHNDEVIVSIKDRGTGIDPDIQDKLFSKFATKSDTGSGLGLYISKGIVEAHGGRIWAENNSDGKKGATFSFSLPI